MDLKTIGLRVNKAGYLEVRIGLEGSVASMPASDAQVQTQKRRASKLANVGEAKYWIGAESDDLDKHVRTCTGCAEVGTVRWREGLMDNESLKKRKEVRDKVEALVMGHLQHIVHRMVHGADVEVTEAKMGKQGELL